ncbi:hypothetical protein A2U01_0061605, partial [Trifolium medium]|nr:hypothetical protein [Trifolium medium]
EQKRDPARQGRQNSGSWRGTASFLAQRPITSLSEHSKILDLAQRDHPSLSDEYPDFRLRLDNLP